MAYDFIDYNVIGGHHGGKFILCVVGAAESYGRFDKKHRKFMYDMMAVTHDLGIRLINNDNNIAEFCAMEGWNTRRFKPKPGDDEATLIHHLSMHIFSTESRENDNNATVYGRVLEFFMHEGIEPGHVVKYLCDNGGIYGVYDQVVAKYPKRERDTVGDDATTKRTYSSERETSKSHHYENDDRDEGRQSVADQIVEVGADSDQLSKFLQLRPGDRLNAVIECVGWRGEWVDLKFLNLRSQIVLVMKKSA